MDSGVHVSLHSNCHHQILYAKFDLKVFYPPPYESVASLPGKLRSCKKSINLFHWESSFNNLDVNEQVSVFNETINRDPHRMNRYVKNLTVAINDFHKKFVWPSSNMDNLFMFKNLQKQLIQSM